MKVSILSPLYIYYVGNQDDEGKFPPVYIYIYYVGNPSRRLGQKNPTSGFLRELVVGFFCVYIFPCSRLKEKEIEILYQGHKKLAVMASTTINKNIFNALSIKEEPNIKQVNSDASEANNKEFITADGFTVVEKTQKKTTTKKVLPKTVKTVGNDTPAPSPLKISLADFPAPSSAPLTKEQKQKIYDSNLKQSNKSERLVEEVVDERTAAFNHMADKDKVAKSLTRTKACHNVARNKETGEFGVCWRKVCTFAHSSAEFQPPQCSFDRTCRFKHGRNDRKTRKRIPGSQCKFRHSDETIEEYYNRSGVKQPDLPPTSEKTYKIAGSKPSEQKKEQKKEQSVKVKKYTAIPPPSSVPTRRLSRSKKSRWDEKPEKESPSEENVVNQVLTKIDKPPIRTSKRRPYDSESESSDSESESSDSDEERRSHRKRSRTPKKSPEPQIIRVPTKELAAIAIKAAFDRGQYNVRVMIE